MIRNRMAVEAYAAAAAGLHRLARILLREKDRKANRGRIAGGEEVEVADESVLLDRHIDQRVAHCAGRALHAEAGVRRRNLRLAEQRQRAHCRQIAIRGLARQHRVARSGQRRLHLLVLGGRARLGEEDIHAQHARLAGSDAADGRGDERARNRILTNLREARLVEVDEENLRRRRAQPGVIDDEVVRQVVDVAERWKPPRKQHRDRGNRRDHQPVARAF